MVAVGSEVVPVKGCKTFPDFLAQYIKMKLGPEWGNAEIAKPMAKRHPILQWYHEYCLYQAKTIPIPGEVSAAEVTGVVGCYLGLAYGLYLLAHNVELQERLIRRLKDTSNFQGAYYEVIVARALILAGFTLELEDETDGATRHCEFSATKDGKKYSVEARMRSIAGVMGKTAGSDGGADTKPLKKLVQHLNGAFSKPAQGVRLIFIDLNTAQGLDDLPTPPRWVDDAIKRLEEYEQDELPAGDSAYVFVTNVAYHRTLDRAAVTVSLPFGLGCDFVKPGQMTLSERCRREQRHRHGHEIIDALKNDLNFPTTFDGSLPSETWGAGRRALLGETYLFEDVGEHGTVGTVTDAVVNDANEALLSIRTLDGSHIILTKPMSDEEMNDYRRHPDAYFGRVVTPPGRTDDPYELFKWLMEVNKRMSHAGLLKQLKGHPALADPNLSDDDLRMIYCDGLVANVMARRAAPKVAPSAARSDT
jgi:hypothetical protein